MPQTGIIAVHPLWYVCCNCPFISDVDSGTVCRKVGDDNEWIQARLCCQFDADRLADSTRLPEPRKEIMKEGEPITAADLDLQRRVANFLVGRQMPGLRNLKVEAHDGVVTLRGRVYTFYEKQLCNQCCRRVAGVLELINSVDVLPTTPGAAVVA